MKTFFFHFTLIVIMAMSSAIDDTFDTFFQEIAGDIVFPMVSGIFREFNNDLLKAKSDGYSPEEAQTIAIGDFVSNPGLADNFEPDDSVTAPPTTTVGGNHQLQSCDRQVP